MSPDLPFAGRVVLVTGASGGLGGAVCELLADQGAMVIASGRHLRRLNALHARVEDAGGALQLYPMDLAGAQPGDLVECIDRVEAAHGRLDGVVHCAADFPGLTPLEHADPARIAQTIHVNLTARVWLTQAALPSLKRHGGVVVFVEDAHECVEQAYWGAYALTQVTQARLAGLFERESTAASGIRVLRHSAAPMPTALRGRAFSHEQADVSSPHVEAARLVTRLTREWLACAREVTHPLPECAVGR